MEKKERNKIKKESNMSLVNVFNKHKKTFIIVGAAVILAAASTTTYFVFFNKEEKEVKRESTIDKDNPTYDGKKIYKDGDNTIIEENNNSKTIEKVSSENNSMTKASSKIQKQYEFTDVKVKTTSAKSIITGEVKNVSSKYSDIVINVKFYKADSVVGSASKQIKDLKKSKKKSFKIEILGDYTDCTYKTIVEYVK